MTQPDFDVSLVTGVALVRDGSLQFFEAGKMVLSVPEGVTPAELTGAGFPDVAARVARLR